MDGSEPNFSELSNNNHFSVYSKDLGRVLGKLRRSYKSADVLKSLRQLKELKVLVVGDAIVDRYVYSVALGRPSKAMTLAVKSVASEDFAGGAIAAANHLSGFCGEVGFVTCLGKKESLEDFIRSKLKENVKPIFFHRDDATTIIKKRYVTQSHLQKLFEEYVFNDEPIGDKLTKKIAEKLEKIAPKYDLVLVLDYGHGFLNKRLISVLAKKARFLAANAQTNSANTGFNLITKYKDVDYACIDEIEIRLALSDRHSDIKSLAKRLSQTMGVDKVMVTMGHQGSLAYYEGKFFHCPPFSAKPVDPIGAGDAYIAITSPCVATGMPMDLVSLIGNAAGAIAIKIVGNRSSVEPKKLFEAIAAV